MDKQWREAVRVKVEACGALSVDEQKLVEPLFTDRPEFVECRRRVYEKIGIGRDSNHELDGAVADLALGTLKAGRTDRLNIPRGTKLYDILRETTKEILYPDTGDGTGGVEGFDLGKLNLGE